MLVTADNGALTTLAAAWEQLEEGVITNITDDNGAVMYSNLTASSEVAFGQVGTTLTIVGERLRGGGANITGVTLAGVPVLRIVSESDTEVVVIANTSSDRPIQGDVILVADSGATVRLRNGFKYIDAGVISSVTPLAGQLGTFVTIVGERLFGGGDHVASVRLGDVVVSEIVSQNATLVVVRAGESFTGNFTDGDVVVSSDTDATITATESWDYLLQGVIQHISPSSGVKGTRVTIRGERLLGGGINMSDVRINGISAEIVTFNDTVVEIVLGESGIINATENITTAVVLTSDTGATVYSAVDAFTHLAPGIITFRQHPDTGQDGTVVTVCGAEMLGGGSTFESVFVGPYEGLILSQDDTCVVFEVLIPQPEV